MKEEITDMYDAINMLYGIDGGQVNATFIKLIVEVEE